MIVILAPMIEISAAIAAILVPWVDILLAMVVVLAAMIFTLSKPQPQHNTTQRLGLT